MLLDEYKAFRAFCQTNGIRFWVAGGTMIGAVRHQGFIPWDDDIDVYLLREDYDRLLSLAPLLEGTDYEIVGPADEDYFCAMHKFAHRGSTIWEMQTNPCLFGVYLDIFVLDYEQGTYEEVARRRRRFERDITRFRLGSIRRPWAEIGDAVRRGRLDKAVWYLWQKCVLRPLRPYYLSRITRSTGKTGGEWLVANTGTSGRKDIFRSEWFAGSLTFPFEDTEAEVPTGYDQFLTAMYGDYMQLPPVEKRNSHHGHYYINLDRRVTVEEARGEMRGR